MPGQEYDWVDDFDTRWLSTVQRVVSASPDSFLSLADHDPLGSAVIQLAHGVVEIGICGE